MTTSLFCAERVRNFNGFTLKPGMWAGRDEKGFFACTRIMQKKDPGHHLHLYRLDKEMNRGWSMVWESSETTQEIMRAVLGADQPFVFELNTEGAPRNGMAQVRRRRRR